MSKAEERAMEHCCAKCTNNKLNCGMKLISHGRNCIACSNYIEGYSQAERDLELSWEDIEEIYLLVIEIDNAYMEANAQNDYQYDVKEMYQEVLKRFKERKETKD